MKIDKSELIKKINMLEKVIPSKPSIACMEGILVRDGRLCANNLQNAISIATPEAEGENFILPKKAIAMAKSLPDGLVRITPQNDNSIIINAATIRSKMNSFAPDDFPDNHMLEDAEEITMDFEILIDMLSNVAYATSTNESRPVHTGVLLEGDGENLNVVATDGYRCAWAHTPYDGEFKFVIPKPTVKLLLSIKDAGKISIQTRGEKAVFKIGDCEIYSRLLSGSFLEYRRVFPNRKHSVGVERKSLLDSMGRIMICSDDAHKGKVEMECARNTMQIRCRGSAAEYIEELEVTDSFSTDLRIMFNSAFFIDALRSYDCSVIDCFFGEQGTQPLVLDDGQLKSMILPVRMSEDKK